MNAKSPMNRLSLRNGRLKFQDFTKLTRRFRGIYKIYLEEVVEEMFIKKDVNM